MKHTCNSWKPKKRAELCGHIYICVSIKIPRWKTVSVWGKEQILMGRKSVWRRREFFGLWEELKRNHVLQKQRRVWSRKYRKDIKLWEEPRGFMYNLLCLSMFHFWFKVPGYVSISKNTSYFFRNLNIELNLTCELWLCFTHMKTATQGKADITVHVLFHNAACTEGMGDVIHLETFHILKPLWCPVVKEETFFPPLEKTNSGILSNRVYCMCMRIFVFPFPPFFPIPINSWWNYCIVPWKLPDMSRCFTLKLIAREKAGVQLTVRTDVKWQGLWSQGGKKWRIVLLSRATLRLIRFTTG